MDNKKLLEFALAKAKFDSAAEFPNQKTYLLCDSKGEFTVTSEKHKDKMLSVDSSLKEFAVFLNGELVK